MKKKVFLNLFFLSIVSLSAYAMEPQARYRFVNKADGVEEISAILIPAQSFIRSGIGRLSYDDEVDSDFNLGINKMEVNYFSPEQGSQWTMVFDLAIPKNYPNLITIYIFNNFCRVDFGNGKIKEIPGNLRRIKSSLTQESSAT